MASCTLLEKLPRELRDQIYEEALIVEEVTIDADQDRGAYIPGLLQTCKQIRAEASKTFYKKNHFKVITPQTAMFTPVKWLESIRSRYRKRIRKITVDIKFTQYHPGLSFALADHQDTDEHILHNILVTESRHFSDKRRVETYALLEQLVNMPRLRRKVVAFEVAGPAHMHMARVITSHVWIHELEDRLFDLSKQFAEDRGLAKGCPVCHIDGKLWMYSQAEMAKRRVNLNKTM